MQHSIDTQAARSRILRAYRAVALLLASVSGLCAHSIAADFAPALGQAEWQLATSASECRLSQPIPYFGEAVFLQRAGDTGQFRLNSRLRLGAGASRLKVMAPPWREAMEPLDLGTVVVGTGPVAIELGETLAEQMLLALFEGLSPVFEGLPTHAPGGSSSVGLLSVNFRRAYSDFRDCLAGLPVIGIKDIERTRISYAPGADQPGAEARARLDVLARQILQQRGLRAIYVDGYTDDTGRSAANIETSRRRAEGVTAYLVGRGVPAALITTRYHGSRYPVARGRSAAARAQNRRVTVRLE